MPSPADLEARQAWLNAFQEGRRFRGFVTWKPLAQGWVKANLEGNTLREMEKLLHDHVAGGGTLDQVRERRKDWLDFEFHFDLRLDVGGKKIYVETVLVRADPRDPLVEIVNVHLA
ncbi:MAG TPA: hypothetical protein VND64_33075 [Pirellulales bacterium]|nr:hypothetical protein [Pirellulales bacterium]